jgi:ABC-type multidrug transport system fused ATPase/permease subunit
MLATVKAVLQLSGTPRFLLPLLVILGLAASFAESLGISLIVLFLYSAMGSGSEAAATSGLVGKGFAIAAVETGGGTKLAIAIFGMLVANIGLTFTYALINAPIRYRLSEAARNRLTKQFLEVSYDFMLRQDQGHLLNVLATESWSIGDMYICICSILINALSAAILVLFLLALSWKLLIVAAPGITLLLVAMHYLSGPARKLGRRMRSEHEGLAGRMLVMLQGMRALRTFGQERRYQHSFERASAEVRRTSIVFDRLDAVVSPAVQVGYLLLLVVIVLVSYPIGVSFSATLAFVALLYRLQPHVRELESNLLRIAQLEAPVRSVMGMLDRSNKIYLPSGVTPFSGLHHEIRFETVSFSYTGAPSPSLDQISFAIPAGAVTALVGRSGAGKTTIVNLLLKLYQPDSGSILVDGVRLEELDRTSWLSRIAAAGQDLELIEGTVKDNLHLASPQADLPAIRAAANTAGILETIENLPEGFDSWIGQQGLKLSGGQRQRLGLARALLHDPDILILDEATNALDGNLEHEIWGAIRRRLAGRTLLVITHRLETVMSADQVICIGSGCLLECGSTAEFRSRPASVLWTLLKDAGDARDLAASGMSAARSPTRETAADDPVKPQSMKLRRGRGA